jgi:hypothetical protein
MDRAQQLLEAVPAPRLEAVAGTSGTPTSEPVAGTDVEPAAVSTLAPVAPAGIGAGLAAVLVAVVAVLTLAATAFVVATTYSPFIYFRF